MKRDKRERERGERGLGPLKSLDREKGKEELLSFRSFVACSALKFKFSGSFIERGLWIMESDKNDSVKYPDVEIFKI